MATIGDVTKAEGDRGIRKKTVVAFLATASSDWPHPGEIVLMPILFNCEGKTVLLPRPAAKNHVGLGVIPASTRTAAVFVEKLEQEALIGYEVEGLPKPDWIDVVSKGITLTE
jgi:hypothetical protein